MVQERNLKNRKYVIHLPSGLLTVRNCIALRRRFLPTTVPTTGTSKWSPVNLETNISDDPESCIYSKAVTAMPHLQSPVEVPSTLETLTNHVDDDPIVVNDCSDDISNVTLEDSPKPVLKSVSNRKPPVQFSDYVCDLQ